MKTRPLVAALLLAAAAPAAFELPARAQAEDTTTTMARARFKEGVEFYDKGEYEQARASFLQAYALKKHPAVLLNLAWSCLKSGHALEAERYFKQFLSEGKDITDKQRADANDGLSQSRAKLGRIEVSAAAGTEVTVDGEKVGTTPLTDPIAVEAGAHTVKFKASDGGTETQSVTVLGGEKALAKYKASGGGAAAAGGASSGGGGAPPAESKPSPEPEKIASAAKPEEAENKPAEEPHKEAPLSAGGRQWYSPPNNLVPVYVLGGTAVVAAGAAIVMAVFKNQAQTNANTVGAEIVSHLPAGRSPTNPPICQVNTPQNLVQACHDYATDIDQVNQDATAANIAIGVGAAALVGTAIYWVVADKAPDHGAMNTPVITPTVGRSQGGLSLTMSF
jgi:hypothetical protein